MRPSAARPLRIAIGIDDLFAPVPGGGGQGRVIINLIRNLAVLDRESRYTLFSTRKIAGVAQLLGALPPNFRFVQIPASRPALRFLQWHVLRRPFIERWIGLQDVIHATTPGVVPPTVAARMVLTVYDLVWWRFPEGLNGWGRFFHRTGLFHAIRHGAAIAAISDATRREIRALAKGRPIKGGLHVFPIAASEPEGLSRPAASDVALRLGISKQYVVTVGTLEPRKNHRRLLEAFASLPREVRSRFQLVVIGAVGWKVPPLRDTVQELGLEGQVVWTDYLPDRDMEQVVAGATVFAYPSLYEGFGIPVLEAMRLGVPVLTSNVSSMPEVAGDAAVLVDPHKRESIADGLLRLLTDPELRVTLIARGRIRVRAFSFRRMAEQYLALYMQLGTVG